MKILVLIVFALIIINNAKSQDLDEIQAALSGISDAVKWAKALKDVEDRKPSGVGPKLALGVCIDIYEGSDGRLQRLVVSRKNNISFSWDDAIAWLSSALAGNTGCLDGLTETGMSPDTSVAQKLNDLLEKALAAAEKHGGGGGGGGKHVLAVPTPPNPDEEGDNLATWTPGKSKADMVVAQDGSGQYKTITEALAAVAKMSRPARTIIYVKSGIYQEQVKINDSSLNYLMFVGDGIGKTIVTGSLCYKDTGGDTPATATFYVVADGFWARDITFRNTAGPAKGQAVAQALNSDESVIYRCSFEGYQDTLLAWFNRQFFRDCQIHGTMDFLFGNAAAVFQNCDFIVRLPLPGSSNVITAQGRDSPDKTGFVIMDSRIVPDADFAPKKRDFKTYLGRPWQRCSRVLFARTEMDDLVDPEGWTYNHFKPDDSCGMFFGEFRDTGKGAATDGRVHWPNIYAHVKTLAQINLFTVKNFIQGTDWLPASGVPFSPDAF